MFDFHNHFTGENALKYGSELLPQNLVDSYDITKVISSEVGLDKRFSSIISLEKQALELWKILMYAKQNEIPVQIHCVQATELMIQILSKAGFPPYKVVWHNFTGSKETAYLLAKLGVIISISPRFKGDLNEIFKANPNFVLETDYDGNNAREYEEILVKHYLNCAEMLNIPLIALEQHCNELKQAFLS